MKKLLFLTVCGALLAGCKLVNPTGPSGTDITTNPGGFSDVIDTRLIGYWDKVDTTRAFMTDLSGFRVKWQFTASSMVENEAVLYPQHIEGFQDIAVFADKNMIGTKTTSLVFGTSSYSTLYDYTIKDTLGTTWLLVRPSLLRTTYEPVEFSDMIPVTGGVACFKEGTDKTNSGNGIKITVDVGTVDADVIGTWSVCSASFTPVTVVPIDPSTNPWIISATGVSRGSYPLLPGPGYTGTFFSNNCIMGLIQATVNGAVLPDTTYNYSYIIKDTLGGTFMLANNNYEPQFPLYSEPTTTGPLYAILKKN